MIRVLLLRTGRVSEASVVEVGELADEGELAVPEPVVPPVKLLLVVEVEDVESVEVELVWEDPWVLLAAVVSVEGPLRLEDEFTEGTTRGAMAAASSSAPQPARFRATARKAPDRSAARKGLTSDKRNHERSS